MAIADRITPPAISADRITPARRTRTPEAEDRAIRKALRILEDRCRYVVDRPILDTPATVRSWLHLRLAELDHEEFWCAWLSSRNAVIEFERASVGTLTQTSIYPREIVKRALHHNAAGVIFAHNHPSGQPEPSEPDKRLTQTLKAALALVDVQVLDHFIIAPGSSPLSFAERGLL